MITTLKTKVTGVFAGAMERAFRFLGRGFEKRKAGDQQLIVAIVMIAIAVGLLFIFRDKLNTLVGDFMTTITTKINNGLGGI